MTNVMTVLLSVHSAALVAEDCDHYDALPVASARRLDPAKARSALLQQEFSGAFLVKSRPI